MLFKKDGWPEEDELILCTVTSVQYNSVFCNLDEYPGKSGMIHISEVTAGRIRNIRDYVQEGRKVVCKVLRIDQEKGHIDLSLRRVNERQRIEKNQALKQEAKAENLIAYLAKERKEKLEDLYAKVAPALLDEFEYIHQAFQEVADGEFSLEKTKLDKKLAQELDELVKDKIKPTQVQIQGKILISTFKEKGVELVREALESAEKKAQPAEIRYIGAGTYKITVSAEEYKDAEKRLKQAIDTVESAFKKDGTAKFSFERIEA